MKAHKPCLTLGRPVRRPSDVEARRQLAAALSMTPEGVDLFKAGAIAYLPLMDVALEGLEGAELAEDAARTRRAA